MLLAQVQYQKIAWDGYTPLMNLSRVGVGASFSLVLELDRLLAPSSEPYVTEYEYSACHASSSAVSSQPFVGFGTLTVGAEVQSAKPLLACSIISQSGN